MHNLILILISFRVFSKCISSHGKEAESEHYGPNVSAAKSVRLQKNARITICEQSNVIGMGKINAKNLITINKIMKTTTDRPR